MALIKLTLSNDGVVVRINPDYVVAVSDGRGETTVWVDSTDQIVAKIKVKESGDDIEKLMLYQKQL